jgi:hypothetical protein
MSGWQVVGLALVLIGVGELVLFQYLAPRRENVRRRMPLLIANSAVNVLLGFALAMFL